MPCGKVNSSPAFTVNGWWFSWQEIKLRENWGEVIYHVQSKNADLRLFLIDLIRCQQLLRWTHLTRVPAHNTSSSYTVWRSQWPITWGSSGVTFSWWNQQPAGLCAIERMWQQALVWHVNVCTWRQSVQHNDCKWLRIPLPHSSRMVSSIVKHHFFKTENVWQDVKKMC